MQKKPNMKAFASSDDDENVDKFKPTDKTKTPFLDSFGKDLTRQAQDGKMDIVVGRVKELDRTIQILSRRKKNNPLLIGDPGSGKTAVAELLAQKIVAQEVPRALHGKRVVSLDMASMVAGTKYRGQFEERMKTLIAELEKNRDVILFIDEIHTLIGAGGSSGSLDASNILKPALARGEIQCIGATTLDEYRKHIEKDGALSRRFQQVLIEPATVSESIEILSKIAKQYEEHHLVSYPEDAIKACVDLSDRYISDRCLPDKAIDVMDEVGAKVRLSDKTVPKEITDIETRLNTLLTDKRKAVEAQKYEEAAVYKTEETKIRAELTQARAGWEKKMKDNKTLVTADDVAKVVSSITGVPINTMTAPETQRLLEMAERMQAKVIGQDKAVVSVTNAVRRSRVGLKPKHKPSVFLAVGPSGVGKTHLAKALAEELFGDKDAMIRIDMSEYMEKFTSSRLIGAPPGYVGYEEGGLLTEKVRRKPYSVVLLDEIEKAHPDIFNVLLQVFDDGILTDGMGRKVDFSNTIIIMTSNVGVRQLQQFGTGVGFSTSTSKTNEEENIKSRLSDAMRKVFAPEFLNRIDEIIFFNRLEKESLHKIIDLSLVALYESATELNINLTIDTKAKDFLCEKGYDEQYGARPLNRAIQKYIEDPLSEAILRNPEVKQFNITQEDDSDQLTITPKESKQEEKV